MKEKIKEKIKALWQKAEPIQSILIFMLILFTSNILWKLSINGDEGNNQVLLFNTFDISDPFNFLVIHITDVVKTLLTFFGYHFHARYVNDIIFSNHYRVTIIWGCTAIKQSFIFLCIMCLTPGPWKHKLWYVPFGLIIVYAFNILRIFIIAMVSENHPEYFFILHRIILKYLFYCVIFLMWVIWEEKINQKSKKQLLQSNKEIIETL